MDWIWICHICFMLKIVGPQKCPMLVSFIAVLATLLVTMSVLFWNYSETKQRRMTKKQSIILDHWGKKSPLLEKKDLENLLEGGETYYGETALRYFHGYFMGVNLIILYKYLL